MKYAIFLILPLLLYGGMDDFDQFEAFDNQDKKEFNNLENQINITNTGKSMFALYDEAINTDRFLEFLQRVVDASETKIYMILDNLRVHHAKVVKQWVEQHKDQIELFYLPAYSPDLNPDEYLNQDYKQTANRNNLPTTKKQLEKNTKAYMEHLAKNPQKVKNFF